MTKLSESAIFRVYFYKTVSDSTGHCHKCCQGAMEVVAGSEQEAIELASRRFAELNRTSVWSQRADSVKTELLYGRKRVSPVVWANSLRSGMTSWDDGGARPPRRRAHRYIGAKVATDARHRML